MQSCGEGHESGIGQNDCHFDDRARAAQQGIRWISQCCTIHRERVWMPSRARLKFLFSEAQSGLVRQYAQGAVGRRAS